MDKKYKYSLGVDIGGTKCAVILGRGEFVSTDGFILDRIEFPTEKERGWKSVVTDIINSIKEIADKNGVDIENGVAGIGLSCGGPLDSKRGLIQCPPNLPDWDNVPIVDMLENEFKIKAHLQNDANACSVAEWKFGAGRGCRNMIFLTFGTGLGAGLILDGKLYSGTNDMAGEVGHIRLTDSGPLGYSKYGSFEGWCSGGGIKNLAEIMRETTEYSDSYILKDNVELTAANLAKYAKDGDKFSLSVYKKCGEMLGRGLSILIDILAPEKIVIGSIFARSGELLKEKMYESIKKESLSVISNACEIVPAELGDRIGDFAALSLAFS